MIILLLLLLIFIITRALHEDAKVRLCVLNVRLKISSHKRGITMSTYFDGYLPFLNVFPL